MNLLVQDFFNFPVRAMSAEFRGNREGGRISCLRTRRMARVHVPRRLVIHLRTVFLPSRVDFHPTGL